MNIQAVKEKIVELFDTTADYVSVGLGNKKTNGVDTGELSIVFHVEKKLPLSEVPENEILPKTIEIDGITYQTDVIEQEPMKLMCDSSCYSNWCLNPPTCNSQISTPNNNYNPILKGGVGITSSHWAGYVGTMGFIGVDKVTGALVGVTNNHVVIRDASLCSTRDINDEINSEENDPCYQPATAVNNNTYRVGRVVRYVPMNDTTTNLVDCAMFSLDPSRIDINQSYLQLGLSNTNYLPFATTAEIDGMAIGTKLYSTGRTTGPKGPGPCQLKLSTKLYSTYVGYNKQSKFTYFYFADLLEYARDIDTCRWPVYGGDSGSALIADFGGTWKIVGLVFAGNGGTKGIACRIDHVSSLMGIDPWLNNNNIKYVDESTIEFRTVDGGSPNNTITCDGEVYWQIGLTPRNLPC